MLKEAKIARANSKKVQELVQEAYDSLRDKIEVTLEKLDVLYEEGLLEGAEELHASLCFYRKVVKEKFILLEATRKDYGIAKYRLNCLREAMYTSEERPPMDVSSL